MLVSINNLKQHCIALTKFSQDRVYYLRKSEGDFHQHSFKGYLLFEQKKGRLCKS